MVQLEALAALVVEEADVVQHKTALEQGQLDETRCGESKPGVSVRTSPKMSQHHGCA